MNGISLPINAILLSISVAYCIIIESVKHIISYVCLKTGGFDMGFSVEKIEPEYLDLRALATYTSISVRCWRDLLKRPDAPPIYRMPGKILVAKVDIDNWLERFRQEQQDVETIINDVMNKIINRR
jgi:hypothetical protein